MFPRFLFTWSFYSSLYDVGLHSFSEDYTYKTVRLLIFAYLTFISLCLLDVLLAIISQLLIYIMYIHDTNYIITPISCCRSHQNKKSQNETLYMLLNFDFICKNNSTLIKFTLFLLKLPISYIV